MNFQLFSERFQQRFVMEDNFNKTQNPHDSFFRDVWTNPETAHSFIKNYLPQGIVSSINIDMLEICKDSYVTDELSDFFSDILYKVTIGDDSGFVYFLFEHNSFKDKNIHFQLLQYIVERIKSIKDLSTLRAILKAVKNKSSIDEILDLPIS